MMFMNEYEIEDAEERFHAHPVLGPATMTLANLAHWTNCNSDGWAYWPKPCRAAKKLQELIQKYSYPCSVVPEVEYKAALKPIKAFRTRMNNAGKTADFEIVEVI